MTFIQDKSDNQINFRLYLKSWMRMKLTVFASCCYIKEVSNREGFLMFLYTKFYYFVMIFRTNFSIHE